MLTNEPYFKVLREKNNLGDQKDLNLQNQNFNFILFHVSFHNPLSLSGNEQLRHSADLYNSIVIRYKTTLYVVFFAQATWDKTMLRWSTVAAEAHFCLIVF